METLKTMKRCVKKVSVLNAFTSRSAGPCFSGMGCPSKYYLFICSQPGIWIQNAMLLLRCARVVT